MDPKFLQQWVENQGKEIGVRAQQVALELQQASNAHEYAKLALGAQAEDRKDIRGHKQRGRRDRLIFAGLSVLVVGIFVLYALYLGKDEIAIEALKDVVLFGAGGLGGYAARVTKEPDRKNESDDDP